MIQQMGHPDKGDNRGVWSLPSVTRRAAGLVWQRDIKGKRTKLSPVGQDDLRTLIEMNLVEMRDDVPALTSAWSRCAVDAAHFRIARAAERRLRQGPHNDVVRGLDGSPKLPTQLV